MSFNVTVYGAVGDGLTDDRLAIQNAIDACSAAGGGDVYFPVGIYLLSQNGTNAWCIRIYSNVRLLGESRAGSVLKQSGGIGASVRLIYAAGNDCAVSTLTLDGNKAAQSVNEHRHGIFAHLTERLLVEHVTSQVTRICENFSSKALVRHSRLLPRKRIHKASRPCGFYNGDTSTSRPSLWRTRWRGSRGVSCGETKTIGMHSPERNTHSVSF